MKKKCLYLCFFIFFFNTLIYGINIDDTINKSDTYFQNRHKIEQLNNTISTLESLLNQEKHLTKSDLYQVYWRLARDYSFLDDDVVADYKDMDRDSKLSLFLKGESYGDLAIKSNQKGVLGHYWKGIILGRTAEYRGILNSLFAVKPIEKSMKRVIKLDPKHAGAHFVLARLHRKAPPLISAGNIKLSQKYIEKAVKLDPNNTRYLLEMGKIYKKRKKWDKAKKAFTDVISMPDEYSIFQPDVDHHKQEAKRLLSTLK